MAGQSSFFERFREILAIDLVLETEPYQDHEIIVAVYENVRWVVPNGDRVMDLLADSLSKS